MLLSAAFPEFVDPHPVAGNQFGDTVLPLSTGNVVITSPFDDLGGTDAGAVYLFNGETGALISTLIGSRPNDSVGDGGVTALSNGNFVIRSVHWDNGAATNAGAVTFGSGTTGVNGPVSSLNSLVGSQSNDSVGNGGVTALTNGNYVVASVAWDNGANADAGAVTFGSGTTGVIGIINGTINGSDTNSAVGLAPNTSLQPVVVNNFNSTFYARFLTEGAGKVRVGSQVTGFAAGPVVPNPPSETDIKLDASNNLVLTDINGGTSNDALTIKSDTTNGWFVIGDPNQAISTAIPGAIGSGTNSVTIPFVSVSGSQILVSTLGGNDSLTIDFSLGHFTKTLSSDGGLGTDAVHFTSTAGPGRINGLLVSAETIDQTTAITVTGAASFTTTAALLLNNVGNDFNTLTATSNGLVTVIDGNSLSLGSVLSSGISVIADDALTLTGTINGGAGAVSLLVNQNDAGLDSFTMTAGSSITTTNNTPEAVLIGVNTLRGMGTGNAVLREITTGLTSGLTGGRVTIDANVGAIVDGNAASTNITSGNVMLRGLAGVGTSVEGLELSVGRMEGAGGAGGVFVLNSGSLGIGGISATIGISTTTGHIDVRANGALTIEESVAASGVSGNVLLKANETAAASDNLTLNAGQSVSSTGGSVSLQAGDDVTLTGTSTVSAASTIGIAGDSGDTDAAGAAINVAARLTATGTTLTGGDDSDSYFVAYSQVGTNLGGTNSGTITINDVGGTDAVIVNGTNGIDELAVKTTATNATITRGGNPGSEPIVIPAGIESVTLNGLEGNDIFHVQPSSLFSMLIDGGAPALGGIGVPPGDTLDLDPFGNSFTTVGNTISVNGGVPTAYRNISVESIETLPLSGLSGTSLRFDLNDAYSGGVVSATQAGFTSVAWSTLYNAAATGAPGTAGTFGWSSPVTGFADNSTTVGPLANLLNDGHAFTTSSEATAKVFSAKVNNGFALVTLTYGSFNFANTEFRIENADSGQVLASNLSSDAGKAKHLSFVTQVGDGSLNLKFVDSTGDNRQVGLHAISIQPAVLLTMTFAVPGTLSADGSTVDSFQLVNGPANSLVTVVPSLGTLTGTDADSRLGGFQVATNSSGQATIRLRRPTAGGTSVIDLSTPTGEATGRVLVEYGTVTSRNFDFNTLGSETYSPYDPVTNPRGYVGVVESDLFTDARGYGWLAAPEGYLLTSGTGQPFPELLLDSNRDVAPGTFRVALPNGTYSVHVYLGGPGDNRNLSVTANGTPVLSGVAVPSGSFYEGNFNATVSNGLLNLTFSHNEDTIFNGHWTVAGMEIQPLASVGTITPPNLPNLDADGTTVTLITATTTAPNGTEVTVASSLGTITTADAAPNLVGVQVLVAGGSVSFSLLAPTKPGTATIDMHTINGSHRITNPTFVTYAVAAVRRLDFNSGLMASAASPTAAGFVNAFPTRTVATDGFGWLVSPSSVFNNSSAPGKTTTALYRDGHRGTTSSAAQTFRIEVKPGVAYSVRAYLDRVGPDGNAYDNLLVTVEGAASQTVATTGSVFTSLLFSGATSVDGFLDLTIDDLGGTLNGWGLNGLDISESAPASAPAPAAALLQTTTVVTPAVTTPQLSATDAAQVLTELVQAFFQTGLTPDELARLQELTLVIADLNTIGALGLTESSRITLDDDGAGLGWSTRRDSVTAGEYDLWTVIAHELGHVLGREHTDSGVMSPTLSPGLRSDELDALFASELSALLS